MHTFFLFIFFFYYLFRLYETQVKKIIKVQSMIRALLARKRMKGGSGAASKGKFIIIIIMQQ